MKTLLLTALLCATALSVQAQRKQVHYGPEKIAVTGKVVSRTFYGPPGYGENPKTDSRDTRVLIEVSTIGAATRGKSN